MCVEVQGSKRYGMSHRALAVSISSRLGRLISAVAGEDVHFEPGSAYLKDPADRSRPSRESQLVHAVGAAGIQEPLRDVVLPDGLRRRCETFRSPK